MLLLTIPKRALLVKKEVPQREERVDAPGEAETTRRAYGRFLEENRCKRVPALCCLRSTGVNLY